MSCSCIFCNYHSTKLILVSENDLSLCFLDGFPVSNGHSLIVPKRHISNYFDLTEAEILSMNRLLFQQKDSLLSSDSSISGFNIGNNIGESSGQTVFHVHTHLIPRRDGDVLNPKGGVRGVIPSKQSY